MHYPVGFKLICTINYSIPFSKQCYLCDTHTQKVETKIITIRWTVKSQLSLRYLMLWMKLYQRSLQTYFCIGEKNNTNDKNRRNETIKASVFSILLKFTGKNNLDSLNWKIPNYILPVNASWNWWNFFHCVAKAQ
jgi:hypothetical protein